MVTRSGMPTTGGMLTTESTDRLPTDRLPTDRTVNTSQTVGPSLAMSQQLMSQQLRPPHFGLQRQVVSSGFRSLDQLLPAGGVRRGSLVEWLADDDAGAVALAAAVACRLAASPTFEQSAGRPSTIVVVDRGARFHPPAVLPWIGLPDHGASTAPAGASVSGRNVVRPQLVVARPARDDDELWAIDQALRCPGVAAVLAWPRRVNATAMRRWQLAARASGAVGLLVRIMTAGATSGGVLSGGVLSSDGMASPADALRAVRREPTWSDVRVAVSPLESAKRGAAHGTTGGTTDSIAPSVRRLRLSLVGGPWAGDAMLDERAEEVWLDLASGGEAAHRRHVAVPRCGASRDETTAVSRGIVDAGRGAAGGGGVACRAS